MEPNWQGNQFPHQQRTIGFCPRFFLSQNFMTPTPRLNIIHQPINECPQINSFNPSFTNELSQGSKRSFPMPMRPNAPQFELKPQLMVDNFLKSIKFKKGQSAVEPKATSKGNSFLQVCYV